MKLGKALKISDLVCKLWQELILCQEKFAAKLGVSQPTINRWENRSTGPSQTALKLIEEMLHNMDKPGKRLVNEYLPKLE